MKIYYNKNGSITIAIPIIVGTIKPILFDHYTYRSFNEIPENIVNRLSEDEISGIMYFFMDYDED